MGIKNFFKKIGRGIGKVAGKVWNGVKKGAEFVGKVAKPVLNTLSVLPGKLGLIGKIGSAGAEVAKNIIDRIPNQQIKDKMNGIIDKGKEFVDKTQDNATGLANKVKPWADAGLSLYKDNPLMKFKLSGIPPRQTGAVINQLPN